MSRYEYIQRIYICNGDYLVSISPKFANLQISISQPFIGVQIYFIKYDNSEASGISRGWGKCFIFCY